MDLGPGTEVITAACAKRPEARSWPITFPGMAPEADDAAKVATPTIAVRTAANFMILEVICSQYPFLIRIP